MRKLTGRTTTGIAVALGLTMALLGPSVANAAVPTAARTATDIRMTDFVGSVTAKLRADSPAGADIGTWKGSGACFRCDAGPALALAASAALTGDVAQRQWAERILDEEITRHQQANGAFGTAPGGPDIDTMFFANILGVSTILLKPQLDPARQARWTSAVSRGADFLIGNKNLSWYTNGNITLGNTLTMAVAYRLTGEAKFKTAYETALTFAVSPPQARWPGRGLIYTQRGVKADGSDSKGYFTEEAAGKIGFDPEYTQVQLDALAPIYLVTGDARVLGHINTLTNQLAVRVDKRTWLLDTSGGTRKPTLNRAVPYDTGSLSLLANLGGRVDLQPYLGAQADMFTKAYASGDGDRLRGAFGWTAATVIMSQPGNSSLRGL